MVRLCLCVSVVSRTYIETVLRFELIIGMGAYFGLSYTVISLKEIGYLLNNGISVWNFASNCGL